jgi:hypothetical protein
LTGEQNVPLTSKLNEVEVFFNARDDFVQMANDGSLKQLHDSFNTFAE